MGDERTAWHPGFAAYVESQKPEGVVVEAEVVISHQQRADLIIVRREMNDITARGDLRCLWVVLPRMALIEYKSRSAPPGPGVMHQLLGYGHILARSRLDEVPVAADLGLVLAAPELSVALEQELARLRTRAEPVAVGLYAVPDFVFPTWIVSLNELSEATGRSLLGFFGSRRLQSLDEESRGWLWRNYYMGNVGDIENLPDFEQMEEVLAESEMGRRLARRRLQSMPVEETILDLPDEVLRMMRPEAIDALPEAIRAEVRRRLASRSS